MGAFTALFDACVLYPQTLRDALISLARTDLFLARWSADINEEWTRNRLRRSPDHAAQINRTLEVVNQSVEDCLVTGYEHLIDGIDLPDPDDRHVLAAAIVGRADVIVTLNLKDFPAASLAPYNIEARASDDAQEFVIDGAATTDRQSRRLLRPLLASLATKSAAEVGTSPNLYGGRLSFKRQGHEGSMGILGQFVNTPGAARVAFRRSSLPPQNPELTTGLAPVLPNAGSGTTTPSPKTSESLAG